MESFLPFKTAYLAVFKQYFMKKALSFLYYVLVFGFEICLRAFNSLLQFFFIFLSYAEARFSDHPYFFNTSLLYTHRVAHIYSREVPKPAAVFYCWLPSSSIRAMGGVAPCSKALRKLELRKRESLLIHVCCAYIFPAGPETKLGNSLTQTWHSLFGYCHPLTVSSVCLGVHGIPA